MAFDDDFYPLHSLDWMLTIILLVRRKRGEILLVFDFGLKKKKKACYMEDGGLQLFSFLLKYSVFVLRRMTNLIDTKDKTESNVFKLFKNF